jgi:hypothetical protein
MNLAERAVQILDNSDDNSGWYGSFPQITVWLKERHGIVATFIDIDRHTPGWTFPDGSVACEEIRDTWEDIDAMREHLYDRNSEERSYYDI